jgi:hypothetical protein
MSDHGPIESKFRDDMNEVAKLLNMALHGAGFCLLVFDRNTAEGRMNYISNANRDDMLTALKEFVANAEGRMMKEVRDG